MLYGITPPKTGTSEERIAEISALQIERLQALNIDGLVLYDIQDEKSRTEVKRPFPFIETLDAFSYSQDYLAPLKVPKIIYRAVGKYSEGELGQFLSDASTTENLTVFVGAASKDQAVSINMKDAYALKSKVNQELLLGGVTISERHQSKGDEHIRVFNKIAQGCDFFISQGVATFLSPRGFMT